MLNRMARKEASILSNAEKWEKHTKWVSGRRTPQADEAIIQRLFCAKTTLCGCYRRRAGDSQRTWDWRGNMGQVDESRRPLWGPGLLFLSQRGVMKVCRQRSDGNLTCANRIRLVATNNGSDKKLSDLGYVFKVESPIAVESDKMTGVKDNMETREYNKILRFVK